MKPFLAQIAQYVHDNFPESPEGLCIVLPNKRGALFLKDHLAKVYQKTIWSPDIISAEDLITELSGLQTMEDVDLICKLYESYKAVYTEKAEPFESFAKWGHLILQDFNEIDRYLADGVALYSNLHQVKEIENWSLGQEDLTEFQVNYLDFMKHLGKIYEHFTNSLLQSGEAYQGLAYRTAVRNYESNEYIAKHKEILFCGFNALNKAEILIFSKLCQSGKAKILWDADKYYLEDEVQEAGSFLRKNFKTFVQKERYFVGDHFKKDKVIEIVSVPKQIGQAQAVSNIIDKWTRDGISPDKIALVLANEKLLWPVLKMLPDNIQHVNITMEYPVKYTSAFNCIDLFLKIQLAFELQNRKDKYVYHKDFLNLLRHPFFQEFLNAIRMENSYGPMINTIQEKNYSFITHKLIEELFGADYSKIASLFLPWQNAKQASEHINKLLQTVKTWHLSTELNNYKSLELEYLHVLIKNFNRVNDYVNKYDYFGSLKAFKIVFNQIVGTASAAFIGEPLKGLQIMGVLETRTLDFENVIFVSVNEGVLPSGKTQSSFIPNDLKRFHGLPLYGEKDAIYAYHFYRLLQRAQNIFITYDSETDTFGKGEKSRFVSQLMFELPQYNPKIQLKESIASGINTVENWEKVIQIPKTPESLRSILEKSLSGKDYFGLSPSSLITYKDCALKFFFRYGAGLKEPELHEESAEANTFGSILHGSLETLYAPFIGKTISTEQLGTQKSKIQLAVETNFLRSFSKSEAFFGKNLLQQHVLRVYVEKLMDYDSALIDFLQRGQDQLKILALEKELSASVRVRIAGKETEIFIKGKADRIDSYNGIVRVIDYKSSVQSGDKFEFVGFEELFNDKEYDKMLQLFLYSWLVFKNGIAPAQTLRPCIIPFKKFEKEPRFILENKQQLTLSDDLFNDFETHLIHFLESIFDERTPFVQTTDEDVCKFCPYVSICNK